MAVATGSNWIVPDSPMVLWDNEVLNIYGCEFHHIRSIEEWFSPADLGRVVGWVTYSGETHRFKFHEDALTDDELTAFLVALRMSQ